MLKYSKRVLARKERLVPSFIIIGGARAGTTSLYAYLISHPNVLPATRKETAFFNYAYHPNLDWYRMYFPTASEQEKMKKQRGQKIMITGEATPSYLIDPLVPKRISEMLPNVKLIVLLRNPIDRAFSHYHHNVLSGIEKLPFEQAIKKESERINESFEELKNEKFIDNDNFASYFLRLMTFKTKNYFKFSYLHSGKYYEHLKNWMSIFPKKQLLIIKSEDFFYDPKNIFKHVQDFLDLPYFDLGLYDRHFEIKYQPMNYNLRKSLKEYFEPYNSKLYKYLSIDFQWEQKLHGKKESKGI